MDTSAYTYNVSIYDNINDLVHVQVLEDIITETLTLLLKDEFTSDVQQSWEMFYEHIHQLLKYQWTWINLPMNGLIELEDDIIDTRKYASDIQLSYKHLYQLPKYQ